MKKELRAHLLKIIREIWEKKQRVPFREFVRYLNNAFPSDAPIHIQKQTFSRLLSEFMKEKSIIKYGTSLFCMGNSISLLSAEADYMWGMLIVERP